MSNLMLRTASRSQVELHSARDTLTSCLRSIVARLAHDEHGQDMVEYAGVVVVVAVLVLAVAGVIGGLGSNISSGVSKEIAKIFGG